jgi:hypothetical protein
MHIGITCSRFKDASFAAISFDNVGTGTGQRVVL